MAIDIWFYLKLFLLTGLVAVVPFYGWKLCKLVFKTFKEFFVMWSLLEGERSSDRRQVNVHTKLHPYICETDILDEVNINEIYEYSRQFLDMDYSVTDAHKNILTHSHIVLLRDRLAGSLRGFFMFNFIRKKKYTIFNVGTTIIDHQYRGGPYIHIPTAYLVLKELIRHPFTPIYLIGKSFSYKSYVFGVKLWREWYPRYNRKMPDYLKSIVDEFAETLLRKDETYDKERFVINKKSAHMKEFVASVSEEDLRDPHIKYFVEMNPGWKEGNCMVVIGVLTWYDVFKNFCRALIRFKKKNKRPLLRVPSRPTRQVSFIENSSGNYSLQGWGQLHENDYDYTVIMQGDYNYDYKEKKHGFNYDYDYNYIQLNYPRYHVPRSEMDFGNETCRSNEAHGIIVEKPSLSNRVTQSDIFKSVDLDL